MPDREKLVELISETLLWEDVTIENVCKQVADHLIANGVTVQKHGRWEIFLSDYDDCEMMRCSCCGSEFYDGDNDTVDSTPNYCSNCGAKMTGDE